ncbi:protein of unknown function [Rhodovastum atsumiense]|nr:hypothetical protein [Rhodovastum atsumiense]CAH2599857.1 protein of unknown function [Rhodovastum atsumiense]
MSLLTRHFREAEHRAGLLDQAWERALATKVDMADIKQVVRLYLQEALAENLQTA